MRENEKKGSEQTMPALSLHSHMRRIVETGAPLARLLGDEVLRRRSRDAPNP